MVLHWTDILNFPLCVFAFIPNVAYVYNRSLFELLGELIIFCKGVINAGSLKLALLKL